MHLHDDQLQGMHSKDSFATQISRMNKTKKKIYRLKASKLGALIKEN